MEDDLNLFEKGRRPNFFEKRRRPQKKLCNQKLLKVKTIIFLKMEDDLNFFENGRRPEKNNSTKNS